MPERPAVDQQTGHTKDTVPDIGCVTPSPTSIYGPTPLLPPHLPTHANLQSKWSAGSSSLPWSEPVYSQSTSSCALTAKKSFCPPPTVSDCLVSDLRERLKCLGSPRLK